MNAIANAQTTVDRASNTEPTLLPAAWERDMINKLQYLWQAFDVFNKMLYLL